MKKRLGEIWGPVGVADIATLVFAIIELIAVVGKGNTHRRPHHRSSDLAPTLTNANHWTAILTWTALLLALFAFTTFVRQRRLPGAVVVALIVTFFVVIFGNDMPSPQTSRHLVDGLVLGLLFTLYMDDTLGRLGAVVRSSRP